jgi:hypothetical protein
MQSHPAATGRGSVDIGAAQSPSVSHIVALPQQNIGLREVIDLPYMASKQSRVL